MLQLLQLGSLTEKEVVQEAVEPTVEEKHETDIIPFPLKGRGVERASGPRRGLDRALDCHPSSAGISDGPWVHEAIASCTHGY